MKLVLSILALLAMSSGVFGHVLEVVDDAVCVGALSGGWVLVEACRCGHVDIVRRLCGMECVDCLLYTSPSPRDRTRSRMPSSA